MYEAVKKNRCLQDLTLNMTRLSNDLHDLISDSQVYRQKSKNYKKRSKEFCSVYEITKQRRDMTRFLMCLNGARGTIYEGAKIAFDVNVKNIPFPDQPPKYKCITKIFHPNFLLSGEICLDILKTEWMMSCTLQSVANDLVPFLNEPNPKDPLNTAASCLYEDERKAYDAKVKDFIERYASDEAYETIKKDWLNGTNEYSKKYPCNIDENGEDIYDDDSEPDSDND